MPVAYNCSVCRKRLSVSRRKIGEKVECPFCESYTEVPGINQLSLPQVEFSEAKDPEESPGAFSSESEGVSADPAHETLEHLDETQIPQESDTPIEDRRIHFEDYSETVDAQSRAEVENPMWSRPATDSREPVAPLRLRRADSEFEEMDLTPMVDVTFLLLIFFMITASFTLEKTIPTPVPDPNEQSAAQPIQQQDDLLEKSIMIGIESDNTITLDEEPLLNADLLRDRLTNLMIREQKAEVLVTVADLAMHEMVVYVLDTANDVGMQKIRLATAPAEPD